MGSRVKRILSVALSMLMVAMLCIMAVPSYQIQAATKKVTVKVTEDGTEKDVTMSKGQKLQIKVKKGSKTLSKTKVRYSSDDKSVATVSKKGLITAKKGGDAEITITDKSSGYEAVINVTVKGSSSGSGKTVTKLWLNDSAVSIKVGASMQLKVFSKPSGVATIDNVQWYSDNDSVVSVSRGVIKGESEGETVVYATKDKQVAAIRVHVYK
ncbi:Ig-like domain-containing protein [Butyrivibrio sp. AE3004]|uniref:Ig-like domain-containing protein n=1 Tax=Butyrivibrio sp. AE3004 TaxID=1506994 RepID=UPI000493BE1A|nr:Ig-like domain-containing protein [Butyrivibrio sp. AE3004]